MVSEGLRSMEEEKRVARVSATTRCIHRLGEHHLQEHQVVRLEEYATISYQLLAAISL